MGPITKNRPTSLVPQALFILYVFLERNLRRDSPASLLSPLVSLVSPNRGRAQPSPCSTCSNRLKTSINHVNSKGVCKIWQRKICHECEQEILLNCKRHQGKRAICADGKSNTNSSHWGQEFAPAPQHRQNDTDSPAGDLSH